MHGQTAKKISEHELALVVITLTANRIYSHKKRLAGTTNKEIATALKYTPRGEILIGAFEEKSGEVISSKVKESLTRSSAEEDMCPANTPGLYSKDEQSGMLEKKMDRDMMVNVVKEY